MNPNRRGQQDRPNESNNMRNLIFTIVMIVVVGTMVLFSTSQASDGIIGGFQKQEQVKFSDFISKVEANEVTDAKVITMQNGKTIVEYSIASDTKKQYATEISGDSDVINTLTAKAVENKMNLTFEQKVENQLIGTILQFVMFVGVPIVIFMFLFKSINKQNQTGMQHTKSRAKLQTGKGINYAAVAGYEEEKQELSEIVDFLKNPKRYHDMGAKLPKGVLLSGPPGTGKTLLARATAGEAGVKFFTISGSEFLELYVGVGASRVRDMFAQAQQNAPAIIFIDEIDAIGRQRGAGVGGGNDEREQTLNQILVEMDGFEQRTAVVVMAATNRPDVLDPALLRPGRFDRQVTVALPDIKTRTKILELCSKTKPLDPTVQLENIAKRTPGFSGAQLESVMNESALLAVREGKSIVTMEFLEEAIDRVMMGPAKKSKKYTDREQSLVAYHEAGHAVIGLVLENASIVQKITIIPRGNAGGYNLMVPKEEEYFATKNELLDQIAGLLGGRIAEEITFGDISSGAHNDIEKITAIARAMVTEYGMSPELGPIQYEKSEGSVFLGRDYGKTQQFSEKTATDIDGVVRTIIDTQYKRVTELMVEHKPLLKAIADRLIEKETIVREEIEEIAKEYLPQEAVASVQEETTEEL